MNPQNYTINIRPGWGISPVVKVSQGDVGRPLAFTIMDGQDALTIASGTTITIKGTKPSTLGFTQACELSGNTASVETTATMTQEAGAVQAELILTQGTTVIGSANFVMYVEPAAHPEGTTDGDAETARDLMTRAEQAVEQAEAAAEQAEASAEAISQAGIDTTGSTAGQVPTSNGNGGWSWQTPQAGGGGTSDDIENVSSVSGATVTGALNSLSDEIASLSGGAPTPAATVSAMVDTTKIYLYTGSETGYNAGHWYYYSGGQWVDGGQYGEAASMSAGVKAALLACFQKVAWIDENGQTYYDNLYNELYPPANIVSIAAVYTQSGTVYDTASLDDLKPDLVVTANYSDSTSETVTDYTLSGTLAVGTSTVTVTYGGKTATFNVTVSKPMCIAYSFGDIPWTSGKIDDTGTLVSDSSRSTWDEFVDANYRTGFAIVDSAGTKANNVYLSEYDANKAFLANQSGSIVAFEQNTNAKYVKLSVATSLVANAYSFLKMEQTSESSALVYSDTYLDTSGNAIATTGTACTDFIDISAYTNPVFVLQSYSGGIVLCFYDSSKTFISRAATGSGSKSGTIPSNAKYFRISCTVGEGKSQHSSFLI